MKTLRLGTAALVAIAATSAFAFDHNDDAVVSGTRTDYVTEFANFQAAQVRPTSISARETQGTTTYMTVNLVVNQGTHYKPYQFKWDQTKAQVDALAADGYRIQDVEVYRKNGVKMYSVLAFSQTTDPAPTKWFQERTLDQLKADLAAYDGRLLDLDIASVDGEALFSGVMRKNTGDDQIGWYWKTNITWEEVGEFISDHDTRLVDLCQRPNGRYAAVFWTDHAGGYRYFGERTLNSALKSAAYYGMRIQNMNLTYVDGQPRYSGILINTKNALTRKIGSLMRQTTDGDVGCYLRRIQTPTVSGSVLADLQEDAMFHPSSTNKVFFHATAIWNTPTNQLNSRTIPVWNDHTNPDHSNDTSTPTALPNVLNLMMMNSNNPRANACLDFFTPAGIEATIQNNFGVSNKTRFTSRYGVQAPYTSPTPSTTTLEDLGKVYETVRTQFSATKLTFFRSNMINQSNGSTTSGINWMILQERTAAGLTNAQWNSWRATAAWTAKAGSNSDPDTGFGGYSSVAGWIQLPFRNVRGTVVNQEDVFGNWLNAAKNKNTLGSWNTAAELLRDEVRASMATFK